MTHAVTHYSCTKRKIDGLREKNAKKRSVYPLWGMGYITIERLSLLTEPFDCIIYGALLIPKKPPSKKYFIYL